MGFNPGLYLLSFFLALPSSAFAQVDEGEQAYVVGTAYKPGSEEVLYIEKHFRLGNDLTEIKYFGAEGALLATKTLDFSSSSLIPDMTVTDVRLQRNTVVRHASKAHGPKQCAVEIRSTDGDKVEQYFADAHSVMDAGFHDYVQQNWDELAAGKTQKFRLMLPVRKTCLSMKIKARGCAEGQAPQGSQCFRITPSSWMVSALVKPIDLVYQPETKDLLRYQGLGQLPDARGKGLVVDLRYKYAE